MATPKIPITALTGFLGAGKTTLLNHILEHNQGFKIGVVVNDYGDINIDAQLVADHTDDTLELTNGCICCSMDSMELDEAIGQFAYPGSPIDYIIIEASGLAEPADLATTLRRALGELTRLDSVVAVLDTTNLDHSAETRALAIQQIEHSDFVISNKTDLATAAQIQQIRQLITDTNPRARQLTAVHAAVDIRLLLDQSAHGASHGHEPDPEPGHAAHQHLHHHYQAVSFATDRPLDPEAFQRFVNQHIPVSVYRAKGVINLGAKGHHRKYIFQLVGKRAELSWEEWGGEPPKTELVFIGTAFDTTALQKLATACIDPAPMAVDTSRQIALPRHHD